MSQFNIRSLREIHSDEQGKFINVLAKRVSTFFNKQQTDKLENKEDIYSAGQDTESVVKFHDFVSTNRFTDDVTYYTPSEPDGDKVRLWIKGANLGKTIKDISTYHNHGEIKGDPLLIDGTPFDYGTAYGGIKSTALRFNRPTSSEVNQEYIKVANHSDLQISGTSMSYFIRFRVSSIESQSSSNRTLFCKIDDSTPTHGVMVQITPTGRLRFHITDESIDFDKQTPGSTIAVDTIYDVWFVYTVSGSVFKIYVNGVDQTLTDVGSSPSWHTDTTNLDLSIFRKGEGSTGGYVEGDLYDYMILKAKAVSQTEVTRHYTNKWTLADIPFGQVQVTNHYATTSQSESFMSDSFESDSFMV